MFFIEKGECKVTVRDKNKLRNADKPVRKLDPSEYFGEIAMIYKERRSATVASSNYSSLGKTSLEKINEMFIKFPELRELFLERIKQYDDNLVLFFQRAVMSIDYLAVASQDIQNEIIFAFIPL